MSSLFRIIPSLLLKNNRLVKGKNFKNHLDCGDPIKTCLAYESQQCDEIFLVDLDAYQKKQKPNIDILKKIATECSTPLCYGGNISTIEDVEQIIRNGAEKISLNKNLFDKNLIKEIISNFGRQALVGSVDLIKIDQKYRVLKNKKILDVDTIQYLKDCINLNIAELKITFINYEGTSLGIDLEFARNIYEFSNIPIVFEGGIGTLKNIMDVASIGLDAVALGTFLIYSDSNIFKIKKYLYTNNYSVRI